MTAPTPRDAGPALDPRAVEAAAEALTRTPCVREYGEREYGGATKDEAALMAEAALTAAAPFLRAEGAAAERQRIAAAIRAQRDLFARADAVWIALDLAVARIADPGTTAPTEGDDRD